MTNRTRILDKDMKPYFRSKLPMFVGAAIFVFVALIGAGAIVGSFYVSAELAHGQMVAMPEPSVESISNFSPEQASDISGPMVAIVEPTVERLSDVETKATPEVIPAPTQASGANLTSFGGGPSGYVEDQNVVELLRYIVYLLQEIMKAKAA